MTTRMSLLVIIAVCLCLSALADSVWVVWQPGDNSTTGYLVTYGSGGTSNTVSVGTNSVSITNGVTGQVFTGPAVKLTGIVAGSTYAYFVRSTNADGLVSLPSTVIVGTIPVPPKNAALVIP
jgi:hypothetical protein